MQDERKNKGVNLQTIIIVGAIISALVSIFSPAIQLGAYSQKICDIQMKQNEQTESNKAIWQNLSTDNQLLAKQEAVIPIMQQDIKDIKDGQKEIQSDIKTLIKSIKA